jgi:rubredoxin
MRWTCPTCALIVDQPGGCSKHRPRSKAEQARFRAAVLARDRWRCRRCGHNGPDLVAHHWPVPYRALSPEHRMDRAMGTAV